MRSRRLLPLLILLALPCDLRAQQRLSLDPIQGEVSVSVKGQRSDLPGGAYGSSQTLFEGVALRGGGSLLRPDLFRFDFALAPRFSQTRLENRPESPYYGNSSREGQVYGQVGAHILPKGLLGLDLTASRRRIDVLERTGRERERELSGYAAALRLRGRALPTRVFGRRESESNAWQLGPAETLGFDQERTRVGVEASNSKTRLLVENLSVQDRLDGRDFSFLNAHFHNRQRWGKGSRLFSRLTFTRRSQGGLEQTFFLVDESAHLQHTRTLSSNYRFSTGEQSRGGVGARTTQGEIGVRLAVASPLTVSVNGRARQLSFNGGAALANQRRILPGASLVLRPSAGFTLRALGEVGYQWDRFEGASGALGQAVDERHVIGSELTVALREEGIDVSTIGVRNADGTLDYQVGFDYAVSVIGQKTDLLVLRGGRLAEGDTIAVDYVYEVSAEDNFDGAVLNYTISLGYRGLAVSHTRYLEANSEVMSGLEGRSATGSDYLLTGGSFLAKGRLGSLNLRFEHLATERRAVRSSGLRGNATGSTFLLDGLLATLSATWYDGRAAGQKSTLLTGEAVLDWRPAPGLRVTGRFAGYESCFGSRRQGFWGGGVGTELEWRAMRFTLRVDRAAYEDSLRDGSGPLQTRFWAGVTRGF